MRPLILLLFFSLMVFGTENALAFACKTASGQEIPIGGGSANVYVTLAPMIHPGENLVVDLSDQIYCRNDRPSFIVDYVTLQGGSAYGGALSSFSGTVKYNGAGYPFPLTEETSSITYTRGDYSGWPASLYLTAADNASGVAISAGSLIAKIYLHQTNNYNQDSYQYVWNIYANNDVVVPTGGCDVSARDVTVTLPEYPGTVAVPLSVHCVQKHNLAFYLSGKTSDSAALVFTNTATDSPASGIGISLIRNNQAISASKLISLGQVDSSALDLDLSATYARTGGVVTAGNVQSVISLTFVYE